MASITRKLQLLLALLMCSALLAARAQAPLPSSPLATCGQPINLDAASSEVDYKTNTVVFQDVVISQCAMRVAADHARATGLNFANSKWTFEGNVRIDAEERGSLRSDSAVVEFKDNHISRATVNGKPANFEQKRAGTEQVARGHADKIVYDVNEGSVVLSDDAWLSDGQSEISGPQLVYNIRGQRVQAATTPESGERVHITIDPHAVPSPGGAKPPPPAGGGKPPGPPQS